MKGRTALFLLICIILLSLGVRGIIGSTEERLGQDLDIEKKRSEVIKIGVFEPLTGGAASGGQMTLEGIQLAQQLYPEVLGKKVELVIEDNKSDKSVAAKAVTKLVHEENVNALIGSYGSSLSIAAGEVVKKVKIPTVGCSPTNPQVTYNNPYYFRVCFMDPFQGTVMANYAARELGAQKAIIVQDTTQEYSLGLSQYFMESFKELTGNEKSIISVVPYVSGESDFEEQLESIKDVEADVIFVPGNYMESAMFIKQARQFGIKIPIIGGDTWETYNFMEIGGPEVEGATFSTHFTAETPITEMSNQFIEAYQKQYGKAPNAFGALGFDAYMVLINAIERANSVNPEKIKAALAETVHFKGATGSITLDSDGNTRKSAVIKKIENGRFKYVTFINE
ncbi:branched-chain amino acid transport system substrate-binding protein [Anaerosolibacter carboniphilus]|uniref:Branched-chain amino acid transport system substrate-binding protein n=1 Tax=Anaerosolibacter carboniphilus TaxID=1417629 RepID=A0A841KXG4_9FIRM|nr:ABC transporter substrate-binding protein [Anaerosolibacter carboniphilus]MBB6218043.1 branched-chain amino acid transport system substrate-binding protein [Anaerosolibacter carboniphilus]